MKSVLCVLAVAFLLPMAGEAQSTTLAAGARVRVTSPHDDLKKHVTTVTELRGDSIVVPGGAGLRTIALDNVTALDVSAGTRRRVIRDGLIGFGAGALIGGIVGAASYEEPDFFFGSAAEAGAALGTAFGAIGLLVGGVVGAFHRADRWEPRSIPVRIGIAAPRTGGVSLDFSRAF